MIDDEHAIRLVCRVNLIAAGIEVLEAADGRAGIDLALNELPDLVLLDVMMPDIYGWTVARELGAEEATAARLIATQEPGRRRCLVRRGSC